MKLKAFIKSLADIPEALHGYYVADGEGFRLDAEGVEDVTGLKTALEKEREAGREALKKLKAYEGLDPEAARAAIENLEKLGQKKLIDAGEVEKVRKEISDAFGKQLTERDAQIQAKDAHIYRLEVGNRFASSPFIADSTLIPPDMAEAMFGKNFKIEDGRVVGYAGENRIYSAKNPAELAGFDEALEIMINSYPNKDRILKGGAATGSGSEQSRGTVTVPKTLAECKTDAEKVAWVKAQG